MTTLKRMHEIILMRKLVAFAKTLACKRHGRDQEFTLEFHCLFPSNVVGRCCPCREVGTLRNAGHDIIISSIYVRRHPKELNAFKALLLHELAHTHRHIKGHGLDFRRAERRLGARKYWNRSNYPF